MRKKIVAGNWKMNTNLKEGIQLIEEIKKQWGRPSDIQLIVAPPFITSLEASKLLQNTNIGLAAQDCARYDEGAYTGEISAKMLHSVGVGYVILGHSERRSYFGETDETIRHKIHFALKSNLKCIVCCGELLDEREEGDHFNVVSRQLKGMFMDLTASQLSSIIIAYEPVWAIGTGRTATPGQAQEMHKFIRNTLQEMFPSEIAHKISILYGGSCKPSNAKELFEQADIDGGLIGGASLNASDFISIANSF